MRFIGLLVRGWFGMATVSLVLGGAALAQTAVPQPASPQTTTPNGGTATTPNEAGVARGVVPPPRNVDPEMVTPPPGNVQPSMPVIKPPPTGR